MTYYKYIYAIFDLSLASRFLPGLIIWQKIKEEEGGVGEEQLGQIRQ